MKIQFDPNQEYQNRAIASITGIFEGQPVGNSSFDRLEGSLRLTEKGIANQLLLSREQLLQNIQQIQQENSLPQSTNLLQDLHFTIEMETGSGKTYTYLKTIYELNKLYGYKKFVIVVPSIAIREGVLKNLEITYDHFQQLYNHEPCHFSVYESKKVSTLRSFALSNAIEILVINIDSFSKDSEEENGNKSKTNIINQVHETGNKPIEFIQATHPIVIVDEPQNMETQKRQAAIARLNPLCTLRYSATPKCRYNLMYKLDPVAAYELGIVKQISVDSVQVVNNFNQAYIELLKFNTSKKTISAKVNIWANSEKGVIKKTLTIKNGDDLYQKSNIRYIYKEGFIVNYLDADVGYIEFANQVRVMLGHPQGVSNDDIQRAQIDTTVKRHFEKEMRCRILGIKVLSVFFIDRVSNYRSYDEAGNIIKGKFAKWFEEAFAKYSIEFLNVIPYEADAVHNGYFAQDKKGHVKDSSERSNQEDYDVFALIMRNKEQLLDMNEPLRFIFSHSALREGWDNPNVFQICTLNETVSELKKRQEIGRGLRLPVNQQGERILDRNINRLTMVVNESYDEFARKLQFELEEEGYAFNKELIQDDSQRIIIKLKKGYQADQKFLDLWNKIKSKTRYKVTFDTEKLINDTAQEIGKLPTINVPLLAIARADLSIDQYGMHSEERSLRTKELPQQISIMPDFLSILQAKTGLAKSTIASILIKSERLLDAIKNPQFFLDSVANCINQAKIKLMIEGIEYIKIIDKYYDMRLFEDNGELEQFARNVIAVNNQDKTLYSHIEVESEPEKEFAQACETNDDVLFYLKLPTKFIIDTPVGPYNPDWALMYKNESVLYFVAETKSTKDLSLLRPLEQFKIACGKKHFSIFERVAFKVVTNLSELIT